MEFWGWVGAIAASWFVAIVLFAIGWRLYARVIFRKPPVQPPVPEGHTPVLFINTELKRIKRRNGGL